MGRPWMYLLVLVPVVTDVIETGGWPARPREWFTEVSVGLLIAVLVRRILRERQALERSRGWTRSPDWETAVPSKRRSRKNARAPVGCLTL